MISNRFHTRRNLITIYAMTFTSSISTAPWIGSYRREVVTRILRTME